MLKYNLNKIKHSNIVNVPLSCMTINDDLTIITGLCDSSYNMRNTKDAIIATPFEPNGVRVNMEAHDFNTIGTVDIITEYLVYTANDNKTKFIKYKDGKYYYNEINSYPNIILLSQTDISKWYAINNEKIKVKETYFISGNTLQTYDDRKYMVFVNYKLNDSGEKYISEIKLVNSNNSNDVISNETNASDFNIYEISRTLTSLKIYNSKNLKLNVDKVTGCISKPYIVYQDKQYFLEKISATTEDYDITYSYDVTINGETIHCGQADDIIKYGDYNYDIKEVYIDSEYGDNLHIYLGNTNVYIDPSFHIIATIPEGVQRYKLLESVPFEYFEYLGKNYTKYIVKRDTDRVYAIVSDGQVYPEINADAEGNPYEFADVNNVEYIINKKANSNDVYLIMDNKEIEFEVKNISELTSIKYDDISVITSCERNTKYDSQDMSAYTVTMNDGVKTLVKTNTGKVLVRKTKSSGLNIHVDGTKTGYTNTVVTYGIKRYTYIDIYGKKYKIYKGDDYEINGTSILTPSYVILDKSETYDLVIDEIESINCLRCVPLMDVMFHNETTTELIYNRYIIDKFFQKTIIADLIINYHLFEFGIRNNAYGTQNSFNTQLASQIINFNDFQLYKKLDYIELPFYVSQTVENNLNQEDELSNMFVKKENQKAINPIIDMEKDIYYPYYKQDDTLNTVSEITFDLHFRTRDLDTWKINEDYSTINGNTKDADLDNIAMLPSFGGINSKTNWFSVDYYDLTRSKKPLFNSDLLYFLHFTNDDVFYQKSNIKKSFLRLLFYDTPYPDNQSLLYQSTIWLDGNLLFKTYINNIFEGDFYDIYNKIEQSRIGVSTEEKDKPSSKTIFTFKESKRLSSKMHVQNRYASKSSSESFYLYLFKELVNGTCPKTIYLKVMFNHAGEGQSCLFMLPKKSENIKNIEEQELLDLTKPNDLNTLKKGIKIENYIDYVFIPITIEFNKKLNKFVYYVSSSNLATFDDGVLNFNLYEIKMQDESN